MNFKRPQLRLIKGGKKSRPPRPKWEFIKRLRDFYWQPYVVSMLLILLLILTVLVFDSLIKP